MKIVIFGLTISSSWGNGHATLWRALCNALHERGHTIVFFERDVPYYAAHRDLWELPGGLWIPYTTWADALLSAALHLSDADAAIVTSYCPDGIAASDLVLESAAAVRAFYDLDTPVTLEQLQAGKTLPYIGPRGLADFDVVLSYTGGRALDQLEARLGARRVVPIYGSVDPRVHQPAPPRDEFRCDLSYMGTFASDRQGALEQLFIEPARRLPNRKFLIGGAQYPDAFPWTDNIYFVRHLPPGDHGAFYSSGRMTLNVTREAMARMGYCPSGRLFEAAACGSPILSDSWEGLDEFFAPGSEILVATSTEEATAAIELSVAELTAIGRRARERALDQHTAKRRAQDFELALESASRDRWSPINNSDAGVQTLSNGS
jgi:spore maturation protein CgeB